MTTASKENRDWVNQPWCDDQNLLWEDDVDWDTEQLYERIPDQDWETEKLYERIRDQEYLDQSDIFDDIMYEEDIDRSIIEELNESQRQLEEDVTVISELFGLLGKMVYTQKESVDIIEKQAENTENNTTQGVTQLERAAHYGKDRFVIARDIALVVSGGILGLGGFFMGPFVGVGTVIAGASAGGAAVAGIHKAQESKQNPQH